MTDNVKHPSHYVADAPIHPACGEPIEPIHFIQNFPHNRATAMKYLVRAGKKGGPSKAIEDLEKARQYVEFEIERLKFEAGRAEEKSLTGPARQVGHVDLSLDTITIDARSILPNARNIRVQFEGGGR